MMKKERGEMGGLKMEGHLSDYSKVRSEYVLRDYLLSYYSVIFHDGYDTLERRNLQVLSSSPLMGED